MDVLFRREIHSSVRRVTLELRTKVPVSFVDAGLEFDLGQGRKLRVRVNRSVVDVDSGWVMVECDPWKSWEADDLDVEREDELYEAEVWRHLAAGFGEVEDERQTETSSSGPGG